MNNRPLGNVFIAGLSSAAIQILFLREYFSIFSGNELVIGVIFSLWLFFTALGSIIGARITWWNQRILNVLYVVSVVIGILIIRATRLLFDPGEVIAPWLIPIIVIVTQSDAAFFGGLVFGKMSRGGDGGRAYLYENVGALSGLFLIAFGVMEHWSNGMMVGIILTLFSVYSFINSRDKGRENFIPQSPTAGDSGGGVNGVSPILSFSLAILVVTLFLMIDPFSMQWKYNQKVDRIQNGLNGEIAWKTEEGDTLTLLNNTLYKIKMALPSIEQAVHIPAAMHKGELIKALVIGNIGQVAELEKYQHITVDCIENEPLFIDQKCRYGSIESFKKGKSFDLVLATVYMPSTAQSCRFFTKSFYKRMRLLTGESGIYSFTLPFSENYLSNAEKKLKDLIQTTLLGVFRYVIVIPGNGYTFIASESRLSWPVTISIKTDYLESYVIPLITENRISEANNRLDSISINSINKPIALYFAQKQWLGQFGTPLLYAIGCIGLLVLITLIFIPKTRTALSVGSSGFITGVYSITLLILFQFSHGALYAMICLLMIGLSAGFVAGSTIKRFPFSDITIGLYALITLLILTILPNPSLWIFLLFHVAIGFFSAAQFASRKGTPWGSLYAADIAGGVAGMALCATVLIPYFGIQMVAIGLLAIKMISAVPTIRRP